MQGFFVQEKQSNRSCLDTLWRITRHRLVVPLKRSSQPPEYRARGVAVGMLWAMTPLVGIQMYLVTMTWLVMRRSPKTNFSVIIGCAWTWVTNVVTLPPIYYVFYVTGQVMRGQWDDLAGFNAFVKMWDESFSGTQGFWETTVSLMELLVENFGISMMVGCLPWAIASYFISYKLTYQFIMKRRARREERRKKRLASI